MRYLKFKLLQYEYFVIWKEKDQCPEQETNGNTSAWIGKVRLYLCLIN
jgi:hypothetical protein